MDNPQTLAILGTQAHAKIILVCSIGIGVQIHVSCIKLSQLTKPLGQRGPLKQLFGDILT
jgi:hypothetical protein